MQAISSVLVHIAQLESAVADSVTAPTAPTAPAYPAAGLERLTPKLHLVVGQFTDRRADGCG